MPDDTHAKPFPGDEARQRRIASMLRVDHAGEYAAKRIYEGQLAVLGKHACAADIRAMAAQEEAHLAAFEQKLRHEKVRPSLLMPLWHVAGYALGAATALAGKEAAMACTVAVETAIAEHYGEQQNELEQLGETALAGEIGKFREEELEHHDHGLAHGAEDAPLYPVLSQIIQLGCKAAIAVAKRV